MSFSDLVGLLALGLYYIVGVQNEENQELSAKNWRNILVILVVLSAVRFMDVGGTGLLVVFLLGVTTSLLLGWATDEALKAEAVALAADRAAKEKAAPVATPVTPRPAPQGASPPPGPRIRRVVRDKDGNVIIDVPYTVT